MFGNFRSGAAVAAIAASVLVVNAQPAHAQNDLQSAATELAKALNSDADVAKLKDQRIVIAEFENINGKGDAVPRGLQEMLTDEFANQKRFKVVERTQLNKALAELKLGLSDLSDSTKVKSLGKLVGASYLLVGSVFDAGGGSVIISARIVAIEQGEIVCAAKVTIKNQDTAPLKNVPTSPVSPADIPPPNLPAVPTETKAIPSLNIKSDAKPAGKWLTSPPDFGLLGLSNFFTEWTEPLDVQAAQGFTVGDLYGDGTRSLVMFSQGKIDDKDQTILQVSQWDSGKFKQTWKSGNFGYAYGMNVPPRLSLIHSGARPMLVVGWAGAGRISFNDGFYWDGSAFNKVNQFIEGRFCGVLSEQPCKVLVVYNFDLRVASLSNPDGNTLKFEGGHYVSNHPLSISDNIALTPANVDNEPATEMVMLDRSEGVMSIRKMDGTEKASLDGFSKSRDFPSNLVVRTWKVGNNPLPYIIVTENVVGDAPNAGGYFQLIQFNGRSYERVWSSRRFGDEIVDIQVGAVKPGEASSLLIMSRTKDRYELTKIAAK